ncbi:MAG TPA: hypothetical protein VMF53_04240 [Alphaproteobacteria bacterium]|nr:hypothetical protein [Alphaproteobacteria bacterium]
MIPTRSIDRAKWLELRKLGRARFVLANGLPHGVVGAILACTVSYFMNQRAPAIYAVLVAAMILFALWNSLQRWNAMEKRFAGPAS